MARRLANDPQRFALTNELHARPFQPVPVPGRVLHLAFKLPEGAADRDPQGDRDHLIAFVDRHGAAHPAPDANHFVGDFGRFRLKWERHTEFVSYTLYEVGPARALFSGELIEIFPEEWLAAAPGLVLAAIEVELIEASSENDAQVRFEGPLGREFNAESLVLSRVLDGAGYAMSDFRIHEEGFTRFAVVVHGAVGPRRIGRLVQRLLEIETYRTLAMLSLPVARRTAGRLNEIEREMTRLIGLVAHEQAETSDGAILAELTELAAELEAMAASTAFRFGAGRAYEALVHQRIASLREERLAGRQLFAEFMVRRYDPAMRTCHAAERRLSELSIRGGRIAELLRTRVNVAVEAQNQKLLASMNRRAALQLRLQETVEGLSVVAISYYAVSLAVYVLVPVGGMIGLGKDVLTALVALPVVGTVWFLVRRTRQRLAGAPEATGSRGTATRGRSKRT